jgi:alkanesulfonate monooxygenase SsuD/methylene tetrahydromethanopterin reductase-like flavin-dependent oxidoreductase (luciferase family)
MAAAVAAAGLAGAWIPDHFINVSRPRAGVLDCWTTLAALATATPTLRLGPLVLTTAFRHPPLLARQAATLEAICSAGLRLGLGAGGFTYEETARQYGFATWSPRQRLRHCRETIQCLRSMWSQDPTTFEGEFVRVEAARVFPRPHHHIPIVVAARKPGMLRLAAELSDEWNCPLPQELPELEPRVRRLAESAGRDPQDIAVSVFAMFVAGATEADASMALERAGGAAQVFGDIRTHHAFGTPERIVERLRELVAAGAREVTLDVRGLPVDEAADMLAREILPHVPTPGT